MRTCWRLLSAVLLLWQASSVDVANGDVLVSSYLNGRILRFDETTGQPRRFLAGGEAGYTDFRAITIGPDGSLFAAGWKTPAGGGFSQSNIFRFDPASGADLGFWADYFSLDQIDAGPGGILYGLGSTSRNYLQRWDLTTGAALSALNLPTSTNAQHFTFDHQDNLIVASTNRILRFSSIDGSLIETVAELDVPNYYYTDVAIGPDGDVYATIAENTRNGVTPDDSVVHYDRITGEVISRLYVDQVAPRPTSLAFGPDGGLYVGSRTEQSLVRLGNESNAIAWKTVLPGFRNADHIVFTASVPEPTGIAVAAIGGALVCMRRR